MQVADFGGVWCNFSENDEVEMYLQFEQDKLCFKICVEDCDLQSKLRNKYYQRLVRASKDDPEICRPSRFAKGTYMTIAVARPKFMNSTIIDMESVCNTLHKYATYINVALGDNSF